MYDVTSKYTYYMCTEQTTFIKYFCVTFLFFSLRVKFVKGDAKKSKRYMPLLIT
jgi:hypothetical protein